MWSPSSDCGLIPSSEQFMPYESLPSSTANSLCPVWCHCARSSLEFLMYSDDVQGACRYIFNWLRAWEALIASFLAKGFPKSSGMSADLPALTFEHSHWSADIPLCSLAGDSRGDICFLQFEFTSALSVQHSICEE